MVRREYMEESTNPVKNVYELDSLAFMFIISSAVVSKMRGFKFPTIIRTIAEDSMRYFLVIFTSHFVLAMTLTLGRVRMAVPLSGLEHTASNGHLSRNRSNSFQLRKSSSLFSGCQHPNHIHYPEQRGYRVSLAFISLVQTADHILQVSPCDGFAHHSLDEESCTFAAGNVVPYGSTCERCQSSKYRVLLSEGQKSGGR